MSTGSIIDQIKDNLKREFFEIEQNRNYSQDEKVERVIYTTSAICAGVAVQPIPFADMPVLTTIQGFMAYKIAQIRGIDLTEADVLDIIKAVGGTIGLGFVAQQVAIGLYKLGLPALGGLMSAPLAGGLTYGIGKVMDLYFCSQAQGLKPSDEEIIKAFKLGKELGAKIKPIETTNAEPERRRVQGVIRKSR